MYSWKTIMITRRAILYTFIYIYSAVRKSKSAARRILCLRIEIQYSTLTYLLHCFINCDVVWFIVCVIVKILQCIRSSPCAQMHSKSTRFHLGCAWGEKELVYSVSWSVLTAGSSGGDFATHILCRSLSFLLLSYISTHPGIVKFLRHFWHF